jgi:ABC-type dipeptide/oligopeptide/nickel transport system permease component
MGTYLARRLLLMVPTLVGITFLVFMLIALSPGGIGASLRVSGGQMEASKAAQLEAYLEDRYGLDEPAPVQYLRWLGRVSPVKFGERAQLGRGGDLLRMPRAVKDPPLAAWFPLPVLAAAALPDFAAMPVAERQDAYRKAANEYAQARATSVAASRAMERAAIAYAKEAGIEGAATVDNRFRAKAFAGREPDRALAGFAPLADAAAAAHAAWAKAIESRDRLEACFRAKPFPEAGVPIIPGFLSLAWPDLGTAFSRSRPVGDLISEALPVTLLINFIAFPIIYLVAIPSGVLAATRRGSWFDVLSGASYVALWSIPAVWAGVLLVGFVADAGWFPVSGLHDRASDDWTFLPSTAEDGTWIRGWLLDTVWHLCLPVACLVYAGFAVLSKQTRAAMLENFNADYVRTATAKGVARRDVVLRHVFRNSLLPLITMFVTIFPATLAGSVVVERIFSIPGMGSLILEAISLRDRELILANTLMIACVNLLALLLADLLYAAADPRVQFE